MCQKQYTFTYAVKELLLYTLTCVATFCVLLLDVIWLSPQLSEYSITEIGQELILLIIAVTFFKLAWRYSEQRNTHLLIAGLFTCMLIRELDALFDHIIHGFWFYPAIIITLVIITITFIRCQKQTLFELSQYASQRQAQFMATGLICALVFSRLFGMGILWEHVLGENYVRVVKNIAEEGTEFFGYSLCFISTLLYRQTFLEMHSKNVVNKQ